MKVGLIGCGRIGCEAHLPAYKKYGIQVAGVCDLIEKRARRASEEYGIGFYTTDPKELAKRIDVEVLDVATRPLDRPSLLRSLIPFRKPLLVQKPICYDWEEALRLCQEFREADIPIMVNHNARWAPVSLQVKEWIDSGNLGEIYAVHHTNRFNEDLSSWYTDHPDYIFLDHGLHYIDLLRWYTSRVPTAVSALSSAHPLQKAVCPLLYSIHFQYSGKPSLLASLSFNNAVPAPHSFHCDWFIDGENGSIHATIDSVSKVNYSGDIEPRKKVNGDWVPDGFYGAYKALVSAIEQQTTPPHALADHILTLKMASAAAKSARLNGEWVQIT